jgi:hypothetical protein
MAILAILVGLFLLIAAPFIIQTSLERVISELILVSSGRPEFSSGLVLFSLFYPLWRALGYVAGMTLLVISGSIDRGRPWTFPVTLAATAIPAVSGMFMFLPYISFVGGFPLPMVVSWVGLAGFWGTILLRKAEWMQKIAQMVVLTLMGMLTTHAFVIGIAAQRMLLTRVAKPLFDGIAWWILTLSGEVNWIAVVMLLSAIPLLAMRKKSGWWLALIAALSILSINIPTQIIRTKTLDYLYGALLAGGLTVFLLLPRFKTSLLEE